MTMRLDYFLAHAAGLSRKEARRAIGKGQVRVTGYERLKASTTVTPDAAVLLNGQPVVWSVGERYYMLNKPEGVISATHDGEHQTVLDLLPPPLRNGLHPVGRLDKDTTGLLLLTSDGDWSHRLTSPRSHCAKTYRAWLAEPLAEASLQQLQEGVQLRNESRLTRPAKVILEDPQQILLTVTEGRYHQVRRMLAAVGNHVQALHRERVGDLVLDDGLAPGEYRELTPEEVAAAEAP